MKSTAWAFTVLSLVLLMNEQAAADTMLYKITSEGFYDFYKNYPTRKYLYPGKYTIRIALGNDNLGCTLRVGTKSSNTNLMKLSGPLAVRNVTDPITFLKGFGDTVANIADIRKWKFRFSCETTGTLTVSQPPTVTVPVMMTLTYGPFLTKTVPVLVTRKAKIQSVSASPVSRTYSLGQPVTINVDFNRTRLNREDIPSVRWRIPQGKLCLPSEGSSGPLPFGPITKWEKSFRFGEEGPLYFVHTLNRSVILCESGQTIVEVSLEEKAMTDSTIKRLVFNVGKKAPPTRKTSAIRSRGIETLPPPVIPDPEPPVLPNFELQREKP